MKKFIFKKLTRLLLNIHSFAYRWLGFCAVRAEGGLHPKHRLMRYHDFFVDRVESQDHVLDIGCGNGALAYDVAGKASSVVGIEIHPKYQEYWNGRYKRENITYHLGDATTFDFGKTFDKVLLSNVLEHIEDRQAFLLRIKRLAPVFLLRVPMINRDWVTPYKKELGMYWKCDPTHFIEYTFDVFSQELEDAEYIIESYSIQFGEIWAVVRP